MDVPTVGTSAPDAGLMVTKGKLGQNGDPVIGLDTTYGLVLIAERCNLYGGK